MKNDSTRVCLSVILYSLYTAERILLRSRVNTLLYWMILDLYLHDYLREVDAWRCRVSLFITIVEFECVKKMKPDSFPLTLLMKVTA